VEIANGKWQVTAPAPTQANRPLDDGRCSILPGILDREWVSLALLILWSVFVFYAGLDIVLRSDEGLYAAVARRIVQTNEWLPLVFQGQPYLNKPPLYFWLMALSFTLWGPTEFAARFPSATFGVATVGLVYWCGRRLFDRWVGWVAALIATTTFSTVWHAHEARFDIPLAFWINLAVIALYLAHQREGRALPYLCLAVLAMAIGTMLKGPVGLLLPGVTALAFLVITRPSRVVRHLPVFGGSLLVLLALVGAYYYWLGPSFNEHFFIRENAIRIVQGDKSVFFYVPMLLANFLPWSVFLPSVAVYLGKARARGLGEAELLLGIWLTAFFVGLSLPAGKSERFLVYLIPPFALLMARCWTHLLSLPPHEGQRLEGRLARLTAVALAVGAGVALAMAPQLIAKRLSVARDLGLTPLAVLVGAAGVAVVLAAIRGRLQAVLSSVAALSMALTLGLVLVFFPAMDRYDSARDLSQRIRRTVGESPLVIYGDSYDYAYDVLYYLDRGNPVPLLTTVSEARAAFDTGQQVFGLMLAYSEETLRGHGNLPLTRIAEYPYRKRRFVLVSNRGGY